MLDIREVEMESLLNRRCRELWENPGQWLETDPEELTLLVTGKCLEHGYTLDNSWVARMKVLYRVYSHRVDWSRRQDQLRVIKHMVRQVEDLQIGAFTPVIFCDPEPRLVVIACRYAALLSELDDGDPLTGVKMLMEIAPDAMNQRTRAGIYGGLLCLGDRSHLSVAQGCWRSLAPGYRPLLANLCSDFLNASVVEFLLDWISEAEGEEYLTVCRALARIPKTGDRRLTTIIDVRWSYPEPGSFDEPAQDILGEWPFEEYGQLIKPRLLELAELETDRLVIPTVLWHWGDSSLLFEAREAGKADKLVSFDTEKETS